MSSLTSPSKHYKYITSPDPNKSTHTINTQQSQSSQLYHYGQSQEIDTPVTPTTPYRAESDVQQHSDNNTNKSHYIDIDDKPLLHQRSLSLYSNYQSDNIHADDIGALSDSATNNIIDTNKRINKQLYNKFPKKLRRNITDVNRKLQQFKRIKKHKLYNNSQNDNHLQLYNSTSNNTDHNDIMYRVSSFCVADSYELTAIIKSLENDSTLNSTLTLYSDVLQIKYRQYDQQNNTTRLNTVHNNNTDCFIFTYGCIIFWNYSESAETEFINKLRQYEIDSIPVPDIEMEEFDWCYGMKHAVQNDEITLSTISSLEKLSLSFALAQNVKLSVYEERIAREIEKNSELPVELVRNGKINLSRKDIVKRIGGLFIERNEVNLHFDVLDSPEFFWEQDKFKHVYDRLFGYLELQKRVDVLNKRLDILKELFDMLNDQLETLHSNYLEWIVIWLIVAEGVIGLIGLYMNAE